MTSSRILPSRVPLPANRDHHPDQPTEARWIRAADNPFATRYTDRLPYQFIGLSWDSAWQQLQQLKNRGAIVGPHGTGKTTLLLDLWQQLNGPQLQTWSSLPIDRQSTLPCGQSHLAAYYLNVSRNRSQHWMERRELRQASKRGQWLLIDGIERWNWIERQYFLRIVARSSRIIITAHHTTCLPTWVRTETSDALLGHLLQRLIPDADQRWSQTARDVWRQCRGNMRETLRRLYDCWPDRLRSG